jgi:hypothetical protein
MNGAKEGGLLVSMTREAALDTGTSVSSSGSERGADLARYCRSPCGSTAAVALPSRDVHDKSATSNNSRPGKRWTSDDVLAGRQRLRRHVFEWAWRSAGRAAAA